MPRMLSTRALFLLAKFAGERASFNACISRTARFFPRRFSAFLRSRFTRPEEMSCSFAAEQWRPCTTNPRFIAHLNIHYLTVILSSLILEL